MRVERWLATHQIRSLCIILTNGEREEKINKKQQGKEEDERREKKKTIKTKPTESVLIKIVL